MHGNIQSRVLKASQHPAYVFRQALFLDGWKSPDVWCNAFESLIDGPAVYLFAAYNRDDGFSSPFVAYVGMSTRLVRRIARHNIRPMIEGPQIWTACWFRPTPASKLREEELRYIQKFNPPWNIIGKVRGMVMA